MIRTGYNPALVALSVAIAVFASYTALDLGARVRGASTGPRWALGRGWFWVAGAAVAMGGGIWSMHFVGMLAFEMGMPAAYDLGLTALSLLIAIGVTGFAFACVALGGTGRTVIFVAGPLMGAGVAAMHYTGMGAMRMRGSFAYSPLIVGFSLAIAVVAATAALWLTFRQNGVWQKLSAACVMGLAVAGMHYTGMAAATFTASDGVVVHPPAHAAVLGADQSNLALYVTGATFLILFLAMLASSIEQQQIQAELRSSEERFRAAVKAVRGILWTNDAHGRMSGQQPAWAALTGQTESEYQGLGWVDAVHPDDAQTTIDTWRASVPETEILVHEHRLRTSEGQWRHFAIRAVPVRDARGAVREWVGVHTDITEQRQAEAELRESNEEIQRYAYIVSHDLRAPLVNVAGFTSELEATRGDVRTALANHPQAERIDAEFGEALGFIQAAVTRMESLISAILRLSREGRRRFDPQDLDMSALFMRLINAQRHQIETAGATIEVASDLPRITADPLAIEQIFGNLLDNAVKYLDPTRRGRVTVTAIDAGMRRVCFAVADNGRGIAERDHARVFELFRRSGVQDRAGEGIGLAHVKTLVRALGGRMALTSELGKGSTFSVTLPRGQTTDQAGSEGVLRLAAE